MPDRRGRPGQRHRRRVGPAHRLQLVEQRGERGKRFRCVPEPAAPVPGANGPIPGPDVLRAEHIGKRRGDVSIVIIAHNYGQALEVCDRINLLKHGMITLDKASRDTSVAELNDIVVAEYRRAMEARQRA